LGANLERWPAKLNSRRCLRHLDAKVDRLIGDIDGDDAIVAVDSLVSGMGWFQACGVDLSAGPRLW
jgi:hypothetical protein